MNQKFSVSINPDESGYTGRECPQDEDNVSDWIYGALVSDWSYDSPEQAVVIGEPIESPIYLLHCKNSTLRIDNHSIWCEQ